MGKPPVPTVNNSPNKDRATWYNPSPSAPINLDKRIRYKNPKLRSATDKAVTMPAAAKTLFFINTVYEKGVFFRTLTRRKKFFGIGRVLLRSFLRRRAYNSNMLKKERRGWYQVKTGQSLKQIAEYFSVSAWALARENGLKEEVYAGQILCIPPTEGNAYTIREGDDKSLLCGSEEEYNRKNGGAFYLGRRIRL